MAPALRQLSFKPDISSGSLEAIKWLALVAMTLDHTNKVIFDTSFPLMSDFGRLAMPLFGFVLAYNFARENAFSRCVHLNAIKKMAVIGLLATPFYMQTLGAGKLLPLNIMFTLALVGSIIYIIEKGGWYREILVMLLFVYGSMFVDYLWIGVAYCLAAWFFCKNANIWGLLAWLGATIGLFYINDNHLAILAIPIIYIATKVNINVPRLRLAFYIYYPVHLMLLWSIKTL